MSRGGIWFPGGGFTPTSRQNTVYVGKHGNDASSGLTPDAAKLTFGAGITAAIALTPGSANRVAIYCEDAGNYTESFTVPSWCGIVAPSALIEGSQIVTDNSLLHAFRLVASSGVAVTKSVGAGQAVVNCNRMLLSGAAGGVVCTSGSLNYMGESIEVENGFGIGNLSTETIHSEVAFITITGTGIGIGISSTGELEHLGAEIMCGGAGTGIYVASTGQVDATLSRLECATAYNVTSATGDLRLMVSRLSGTQTNAGTVHYVTSNSTSVLRRRTIDASETLGRDDQYVCLDGGAVAVTVTLYASPLDGQRVFLKAVDITNEVKINSDTIDGVVGDYVFTSKGDAVCLVYNSDDSTWELF